ncbi:uncharacterized protein LOC111616000 [Centruroides sculpturatus]|uniref:uncharacterized protein LOC111616000 n=1 Tax=Centruroides sculpturatus TaxID=218467 RepID=UPI000C6E46D0|nr:uncharacterized protein LOC111616000 [Centruroides sculpturatus]
MFPKKVFFFIFASLLYLSIDNSNNREEPNDTYTGIKQIHKMAMGGSGKDDGYLSGEDYKTEECEEENIFLGIFEHSKLILKCIIMGLWRLIFPIFVFIGNLLKSIVCLVANFIDFIFKLICNTLNCIVNFIKWTLRRLYYFFTYPFKKLKCWICGCPFSLDQQELQIPTPSENYLTHLKDNVVTIRIYCQEKKEKECKKKVKSPCECNPKETIMMLNRFFQKISKYVDDTIKRIGLLLAVRNVY